MPNARLVKFGESFAGDGGRDADRRQGSKRRVDRGGSKRGEKKREIGTRRRREKKKWRKQSGRAAVAADDKNAARGGAGRGRGEGLNWPARC